MKRCPECRRDYYDDSLIYCLEDGAALAQGSVPSPAEPQTAILHATEPANEAATRAQIHTTEKTMVLPDGGAHAERPKGKRLVLVVGAVAVLLLGGLLGVRYFRADAKQVNSIAVMPFVNESGNADLDYLSDGMTDTLIGSLSQVPNMSVKAHTSVFRYKGQDVPAARLASELGVQALVYGRVNNRQDQLAITVELVDPAAESVLWSQRYDRPKANVVSVQSEIANDVSSKLRARLSGEDRAKVTKSYTADPAAYELYLKGRFLWNKRGRDELRQAAALFEQAVAKDPNYALAYAALAETYTLYPDWSIAKPDDSYPKSRAAALKALELDNSVAEAHTALGRYYLYYEWNMREAEREYNQTIAMQPNYATAYQWLSFDVEMLDGRVDQAVATCAKAKELDPLSPIIALNCGDILFYARRYDAAIAQYREAIQLDPRFGYSYAALGYALSAVGRYPEAVSSLRRGIELIDDPSYRGYLTRALASSGDKAAALAVIEELKEEYAKTYVPAYTFAVAYAAVGDKEEAFKWIDREIKDHGSGVILLGVDPGLDDLRSDPRFKERLNRVGISH